MNKGNQTADCPDIKANVNSSIRRNLDFLN